MRLKSNLTRKFEYYYIINYFKNVESSDVQVYDLKSFLRNAALTSLVVI